ncbi:hypothetical protein [Pseudomonas denitrificans (nom. rej.)]|uniref:Uncharacterized protein n=1 Tax=Pseudomonas denitrificans TaxID=43306 RepID=A0A9X7N4P9_PSEDE|nr:hypothetical protein [Pseudomonas denitrificans (nom. rej.)]QEY75117.1 hypothetical protein F1C79_27765 [Pseudomonas denitrificans (nom. rej.)]
MSIKIDGKDLICSGGYYVPKESVLDYFVEFDDAGKKDNLNLKISFSEDDTSEDVRLEFESKGDHGAIIIKNAKGSFIAPDGKPFQVARSVSDRPIYFVCFVKVYKNYHKIDIQLTIEPEAE